MWSSSDTLLLLLPCVALGAVVKDSRNFIQAPTHCKPPFALINDRCVFVVESGDSEELGCSEDSDTPCRKKSYPSKSLLPEETVVYEDAIIDGNNNKIQLDERSFTGTRDCKQGYRFMRGKCREVFNGNRIGDMLAQELRGEFNNIDSQREDIYNIQSERDQAITEIAQKSMIEALSKCKPGYRLDMKGSCRQVFNPASSNLQKERNGYSASNKGFIQALSTCKPGYRPDRTGNCREIYNPASSSTQMEDSDHSASNKGFIQALSSCKPGYRPDRTGNCREIYNPASSNTQIEDSDHSASNRGLLQFGFSACKYGFKPDEKGNCRKIFTPGSSNIEKKHKHGKAVIAVATSACKSGYRLDSQGRCRKVYPPVASYSQNENSGEPESSKGFIQVPGCAAGSVLMNGDCRPVYSGKREVYGEDYVDTNENPLMQTDLVRRRKRSLRNQNHQGYLYSGSEE